MEALGRIAVHATIALAACAPFSNALYAPDAAESGGPTALKIFTDFSCSHAANFTVEQRIKNATQLLWASCAKYAKHEKVGAYLHDSCLEAGVKGLQEADSKATAFILQKCGEKAGAVRSGDVSDVANALFGGSGFSGTKDHFISYADQLDSQYYSSPIRDAREQTDELIKKVDGMSGDDLAKLSERIEDPEAKELVAHEWCLGLTQSDLQHQMRFDVVHPLIKACSEQGSKDAQSRCLERGAVRVGDVAHEFWEEEMSACVGVVRKATAKSLMDLVTAINGFKMQNHNSATDRLFEKMLEAIGGAEKHTEEL